MFRRPHAETSAGLITRLDRRQGSSWVPTYYLQSKPHGESSPRGAPAKVIPAGSGLFPGETERLMIPWNLVPGQYRLVKEVVVHGKPFELSAPLRVLAPRPCRASQLSLAVGGGQGSTGGVLTGVEVREVRGPACELRSAVRFAVRRSDGKLAEPIRGNPSTVHLHQRIAPRARLTGLWHWLNWCGTRHGLVFTAQLGAMSARHVASPPFCDERTAPSGLGFVNQGGPGYFRK